MLSRFLKTMIVKISSAAVFALCLTFIMLVPTALRGDVLQVRQATYEGDLAFFLHVAQLMSHERSDYFFARHTICNLDDENHLVVNWRSVGFRVTREAAMNYLECRGIKRAIKGFELIENSELTFTQAPRRHSPPAFLSDVNISPFDFAETVYRRFYGIEAKYMTAETVDPSATNIQQYIQRYVAQEDSLVTEIAWSNGFDFAIQAAALPPANLEEIQEQLESETVQVFAGTQAELNETFGLELTAFEASEPIFLFQEPDGQGGQFELLGIGDQFIPSQFTVSVIDFETKQEIGIVIVDGAFIP
ncbi:MAG: hypothetical protein AAF636_18705 [Pseudomonadota bacterium]